LDRTKCEVDLALDEFALEEIERVARRLGVSRERIVERAVRHWRDEERSGRLAARPPPFARSVGPHPPLPVAVDLPAADWEAVRRAAGAQKIEPERLIGHAVLLLLADFDSGRVAARVARSDNGLDR
jgi:Ribbon-helix-helix protein, copG family